MRKTRCMICFAVLISGFGRFAFAQEADTTFGWNNEIISNLNLTQASFKDWQEGGENSLAWQISLSGDFVKEEAAYSWVNSSKFVLGFAKISGRSARKSADEIRLESVYTRKLSKYLNPVASVTAKTQVAAGYMYDDQDNRTRISAFIDPGHFTQNLGVGYSASADTKTRLSLSLKETVANTFAARFTDDAETADEIEKTRIEVGLSSVSNTKYNLHENIIFKSRLELFSAFDGFDRIDYLWENDLVLKVTKYINVNIDVDILYDKDIFDKRQARQSMAVGLTYTFL